LLNSSQWKSFLVNEGISVEQSDLLANYTEQLTSSGFPVIFELEHLAVLLGVEKNYLYRMMYKSREFYRTFKISGKKKKRLINSPYPILSYVQSWIKEHILENIEVSEQAYGYVKSRSILDNAKLHLGCTQLLKLDFKDFFGHISIHDVKRVFRDVGFTPKLSYQMAKICCVNGCLPQGAPSSPILSNLIMRKLDNELAHLSKFHNIKFSRYADDLAFSGEIIPSSFIVMIVKIIESNGFTLNHKKFAHKKSGQKKMVTGLCITGDRVRVLKKTRREFRQKHHYLMLNKEKSFNGDYGELDVLYLDKIIGLGRFIKFIEPNNTFVSKAVEDLASLKKELFSIV